MRRIVNVSPSASAPQLVTDYATSHPDGLTLINVSETVTLYLGDDSFVSPDNGVPLPPGMSVPWSGSQELYACVRSDGDPGQLMLTDNIAPFSGQIPPAIVPDVWSFAGIQVYGGANPQPRSGVTSTVQLAGPSTAECLFNITASSVYGGASMQLGLIGTVAGNFTSIASASLSANVSWQGVIDGVAIPYGGYSIALKNTSGGSNYYAILNATSQVTLVKQS
jgi:hypothetical protein